MRSYNHQEKTIMKTKGLLFATAFLALSAPAAFAQTDAHHPADASTPATAAVPAAAAAPGDPAAQCTAMMPMMQQMMEIMQKGMMQGGAMSGVASPGMPSTGDTSSASKPEMGAMNMKSAATPQPTTNADADASFVRAIVAHDQATVELAKAVLAFSSDGELMAWANGVIASQQAEETNMQQWLLSHHVK